MNQKEMTVEERVEHMVARLKDGEHRITPQRLAIFRILASSAGHPSAETIYGALLKDYPTMSLATVYKTLAFLKQEGEVLELQFSDLGNRYDGNKPYPHPHVICIRCKKIVDPHLESLDQMKKEVASETRFKILNHRLDFFGICGDCMAKGIE